MRALRFLLCAGLLAASAASFAATFSADEIRVALVTDLTGTYADIGGQGAVIAAEMAIADMGGKVGGKPIKLIVADVQDETHSALDTVQRLVDEQGVDVVAESAGSNAALSIQRLARERGTVALHIGAAAASLTGEDCSPTGVHWAYDSAALARATVGALSEQGGDSWFLLSSDDASGRQLEGDARVVVAAAGGTVAGVARYPAGTADVANQLRQARNSRARVVALANAGGDAIRAIRQAYELGLAEDGQSLAGLLVFVSDVRRLGLYVAGGLKFSTGFYWDLDPQTRAWSQRFRQRSGTMPTMVQAGVYSALTHYFKAVAAAGTDAGRPVVDKMKALPVQDFFARNGRVRRDGRMVHDMYLVEVKKPSESGDAWDYYRVLKVIPGEQAFRPLEEGRCPFVGR